MPNDASAAAKAPSGRRSAAPAAAPSDSAPAAAPRPEGIDEAAAGDGGAAPGTALQAGSEVTAPGGKDDVQQSAPEPAATPGDWDDLAAPSGDSQPSLPPPQPRQPEPAVAAVPAPEQDNSSAEATAPQQQPAEQPQQRPGDDSQLESEPVSQPRVESQALGKPDEMQSDTADATDMKSTMPQTEISTARSSEGGTGAPPQPQTAPPAPPAQTAGPRLPSVSAHLPPPTAQLPVVFPSQGQHGGVIFSPVPGVSQRPAMAGAQHPPPVTLPAGEDSVPLQQMDACDTCWLKSISGHVSAACSR